jgi:glutamyl-tRNA synthetase
MIENARAAPVKLRFAPSPTGYLHVGNARIALANALFAMRHGGDFLLRLDDTDRERSKPEYEAAIRQDLTWLGIAWHREMRQMDQLDAYTAAADRLREAGRLYPCFESEDELRAKREQRLKRCLPPVYDRGMLKLTAAQRQEAEANGKRPYWRFLLSQGTRSWDDAVLGTKQVKLPAVSDPVLIRADGTPLYTFTSVVDDLATGITHVIRGEDHVTNTGVQIDIYDALGGNPRGLHFAHLPLLTDTEGGKLSKRLDSVSLRGLRQDGIQPLAITSYLARLGSSQSPELLSLPDLAASFELGSFSRSQARFDMTQLLRLNRQSLHTASYEDVAARLPAGADEAFWLAIRGNLDLLTEARHWWDVVHGAITPPVQEGQESFLAEALAALPEEPWDGATWSAWTQAVKARTGRGGKALFMPLRLALTGETHGPELAALLPLVGRARVADRLTVAAR